MSSRTRTADGRSRTSPATRDRLVREAAALFNQRGYAGTSIGDILDRTGLSKGALYNHFESKDAIAGAAFDYAAGLAFARLRSGMDADAPPLVRLEGMLAAYAGLAERPYLPGGCPILNTAIEVDEFDSPLRDAVRAAMRRWHGSIVALVRAAGERGEIAPDVDPVALASVFIAAIEGGIMLSRLSRDPIHMQRVAEHLRAHLRAITRPQPARRPPARHRA